MSSSRCETVQLGLLIACNAMISAPLLAGAGGLLIDEVFCQKNFGEDDDYSNSMTSTANSGSGFNCSSQAILSILVAEYMIMTAGGFYLWLRSTSTPSVSNTEEAREVRNDVEEQNYGTVPGENVEPKRWFGGFGLHKVKSLLPCVQKDENRSLLSLN